MMMLLKTPFYTEYNSGKEWTETFLKGFANRFRNYIDGENPLKQVRRVLLIQQKGKKNIRVFLINLT